MNEDGKEGPASVRELVMRVRRANGHPLLGQEIATVLRDTVREAAEVAYGFCPRRGQDHGEVCQFCTIGDAILWHFNEEIEA